MAHFHIQFDLPDTRPYDRNDWDWQALGEIALPFVEANSLRKWWLGRYSAIPPNPKFIQIRYERDVPGSDSALPIKAARHTTFDILGHLGSQQFLGQNRRKPDPNERGQRVFHLLTLASELAADQLSHKEDGYWQVEQSQDRKNNHFGSSLESVVHLLCNSMASHTAVAAVNPALAAEKGFEPLMSLPIARSFGLLGPTTPIVKVLF